jgi:CheY-like chemotaxis protein
MDALVQQQQRDQLEPADVLVLAQLRPGELDAGQVNDLRRRAPLAAMVVLCGAWCEGEARSGHPLSGIAQVAWHQFAPRWVRHRTVWQQGRPTEWSLPATWREEERLLHLSSLKEPNRPQAVEATIMLPDSGSHGDDWLVSLALAQGWRVVLSSQQPVEQRQPPMIGLWQTDELDAVRLDELADFVRRIQAIPVIAIAGFPRPEDDARIRLVGAQGLIAKPLVIEDLVAEVAWILDERVCCAENRMQ